MKDKKNIRKYQKEWKGYKQNGQIDIRIKKSMIMGLKLIVLRKDKIIIMVIKMLIIMVIIIIIMVIINLKIKLIQG